MSIPESWKASRPSASCSGRSSDGCEGRECCGVQPRSLSLSPFAQMRLRRDLVVRPIVRVAPAPPLRSFAIRNATTCCASTASIPLSQASAMRFALFSCVAASSNSPASQILRSRKPGAPELDIHPEPRRSRESARPRHSAIAPCSGRRLNRVMSRKRGRTIDGHVRCSTATARNSRLCSWPSASS